VIYTALNLQKLLPIKQILKSLITLSDPKTTKLKKAVFALEELKGLLYKHDIEVH
jgi:hypothetical protein